MTRPYLLDNLDEGVSHGDGLAALLDEFPDQPLSVVTGYVTLAGLHHLATTVGDDRTVRLVIGAQPAPGLGAEPVSGRFEQTLASLRGERDLARFPPSRQAARLARVDEWLQHRDVAVRRYTRRFVHGKAYLVGEPDDGRAALVTSANLTAGGLFNNLELGLIDRNVLPANAALDWFRQLWDAAADFKAELRDLLFPDPGLLPPRDVYLRALLDLYEGELATEVGDAPLQAVELAPFQRDGFERARRILARHHGVVYADGVGTGKTMIGLAFIEEYALERGHHALVVAPAQLRESWQQHIARARLPAQVVSFNELATDEQLADDAADSRRVLFNDRDSYRLVIVDEAHALRNPDTTWHRAMARLLGGERKDAVLLTATPVNNGLWDLYHLIMLFARHDRALSTVGIDSVRDVFLRAGANESDPESLDPDVLFPVADAVSVRRDRRFIERHWPGAVFPDRTPVRFPDPELTTVRYDLDTQHTQLFDAIVDRIGLLTMARYRPSAYAVDGQAEQHEEVLSGLLQSGILKRFESSWRACLLTVRRMVAAHEAFLAGWDAGVVPTAEALSEATADLDETGLSGWLAEQVMDSEESRPVEDFRADYREAVADDLGHLEVMRDQLSALTADGDPKLAALRAILRDADDDKVAVFATFGDTIAYLDDHLPEDAAGRSRVTVIGGETDPDQRTEAMARFAPDTVVEPGYEPADGEVDLLLATDVLSEGQNLQQASAVVSYDMPWNPQKVVQRNGRVLRLKSPHETVHLTTMLPTPGDFDSLLGLEARIRTKVAAARGVYGMETPVVEGAAHDEVEDELRSFADRIEGGDVSLLDEDGDEPGEAFAGEELRALLDRAAAEGELARVAALPWGVGAAFRQGPTVPSRGNPGLFLAVRTPRGERYWRYVEPDGTLVAKEAEILRRIRPGAAPGCDGPTGTTLEEAWQSAARDIVAVHNARATPAAAERSVGPAQRFALGILRDPAVALPPGAGQTEQALGVERGTALRRALNEIRAEVSEGTTSRTQAAESIVATVEEFRLTPVELPEAVEEITVEDLGVVCWMQVRRPA